MKAWLLALGLTLFCTVRANWTAIEDIHGEKASGEWHALGLASNCPELQRFASQLRSAPATISQTKDGGIRIITYMSSKKGCKKLDMTFTRREDGKFVHHCGMGEKVLDSAVTDYEKYAVAKFHFVKEGRTCTTVAVYGRERVLDSETANTFRRLASAEGISESQITILPIEGNCKESE